MRSIRFAWKMCFGLPAKTIAMRRGARCKKTTLINATLVNPSGRFFSITSMFSRFFCTLVYVMVLLMQMDTNLKTPLSPLQLELLKAFARPSVDETDLLEIRKMLSQYFARKASMQAQQVVESRNLTDSEVEAIAHQHHRMPYKPQ